LTMLTRKKKKKKLGLTPKIARTLAQEWALRYEKHQRPSRKPEGQNEEISGR